MKLLIIKTVITPVILAIKSYNSKALFGTIRCKTSEIQEINKITL